MKIAIIARILNQNSGARAPIKLAEYLAKAGNEVDFYSFDLLLDNKVKELLEKQGIKVHILHISSLRIIGNFFAAIRLFLAMYGKKYQLVSAHTPAAFVIPAKLTGAFIVRTYYGTQLSQLTIAHKAGLEVHPTLLQRILSILWDLAVKFDERMGFLFSNVNLTISKYLQQEMKELYGDDIPFIYLGAETEKFNSDSIKKLKSAPKTNVTLLSVSRIVPYKGFDLIIKAFREVSKKYPDVTLNIIGSVADPEYLSVLNKLKNDRVKIIHNPDDAQLLKYYEDCQIYVCADLWAPWSLTPLEASFLEKPLLGLDRGAMAEIIINDENGYLATDLQDFTKKMGDLVSEGKLRSRFGKRAREIAIAKFSWDNTASEYLNFFKRLVK